MKKILPVNSFLSEGSMKCLLVILLTIFSLPQSSLADSTSQNKDITPEIALERLAEFLIRNNDNGAYFPGADAPKNECSMDIISHGNSAFPTGFQDAIPGTDTPSGFLIHMRGKNGQVLEEDGLDARFYMFHSNFDKDAVHPLYRPEINIEESSYIPNKSLTIIIDGKNKKGKTKRTRRITIEKISKDLRTIEVEVEERFAHIVGSCIVDLTSVKW